MEWDGKSDRRRESSLEFKIDRLHTAFCREFGDEGLNGEKIEGNTAKNIRLLGERVSIQNGRVTKLENRNIFLDGSVKVVSAIFAGVIGIGTLVVMWIRKG